MRCLQHSNATSPPSNPTSSRSKTTTGTPSSPNAKILQKKYYSKSSQNHWQISTPSKRSSPSQDSNITFEMPLLTINYSTAYKRLHWIRRAIFSYSFLKSIAQVHTIILDQQPWLHSRHSRGSWAKGAASSKSRTAWRNTFRRKWGPGKMLSDPSVIMPYRSLVRRHWKGCRLAIRNICWRNLQSYSTSTQNSWALS